MAGSFGSSASHSEDLQDATVFNSMFQQSQPQRQVRVFISNSGTPPPDTATPMLIDIPVVEEEEEQQGNSDRSGRGTDQTDEASSSPSSLKETANSNEESKKKRGRNEPNSDGLVCSICMEPWGSEGGHQVSCLPCGHVYGFSCIKMWLQRSASSAKCPQCNAKCTAKDVTKLYASPVAGTGEDLLKKVKSLEVEIGSLRTEKADLLDKQDYLLKVQDNLLKELRELKEKQTFVENRPIVENKPPSLNNDAQGGQSDNPFRSCIGWQQLLHCSFMLEHELGMEGARLFDMDVSFQNLILARRISGMGGIHMLNKISLINPQENEDIQLPLGTKAVKDLKVSPCGRFVLLASLGKKLTTLSMGSNNVVITYDLKVPAWSCSWDVNSPHYLYAGLQNGRLLVFDMRQNRDPLRSIVGPTPRPIHTIHSLVHNSTTFDHNFQRKLLTASSLGPCLWDARAGERPLMVPGLENQGICTSLAYSPLSDDIVASYCPKFGTYITINSQSSSPSTPASSAIPQQAMLGSQVLVKRVVGTFYRYLGSTSMHLNDVQTTKSAIINMENCCPLFAYGDAVTNGLRLKELPSLNAIQNLKPHQHPILDVKYAQMEGSGLLGCVSEDKLQLFSAKVS